MAHEAEILFFQRLMENHHIQTQRFAPDAPPEVDLGLRKLLGVEQHRFILDHSRRIYTMRDAFACSYHALLVEEGDLLLVGPYLTHEVSEQVVMAMLEKQKLPTALLPTLKRYYKSLPVMDRESYMLTLMLTLAQTLWGEDNFDSEFLEDESQSDGGPIAYAEPNSKTLSAADIRILEDRYEMERHLMYAVSHGMTHQARMLISRVHESVFDSRTSDPLRNIKNYAIVLNTLLRKAAEEGEVHPVHIDQLSSTLARRIEAVHTKEEGLRLFNTIVHKYCILVKNHSMKSYSLLVQHAILRIESDLTADLSLKAHAAFLNVNPSYLSTLFKKETGSTLTEYVNRKRVDQAIFLLNATDMQVQTIAQYCGIPDVNYFTKTFKRLVGKTPKEYRQSTRAPK